MMVTAVRILFFVLQESSSYHVFPIGSAVAKYAGQFVHKRLVQDEAYKKKDYNLALKNAFLGTDADMRSSAYYNMSVFIPPISDSSLLPDTVPLSQALNSLVSHRGAQRLRPWLQTRIRFMWCVHI